MAQSKSGRELEGETGHKGPLIARRLFGFFGIGPGRDDADEE